MSFIAVPLLALVFASGTGIGGWWAIPVLALVWGSVARRVKGRVQVAMAAGALAWASLLALSALRGGMVGGFGARVAASLDLPAVVPALATTLFPALVAGLAAATGSLLFADSASGNSARWRRNRSG